MSCNIDKTISDLEYARYLLGMPDQGDKWSANALTIAIDTAIQALQKQLDREKPEPLSLEQLRRMDGEPVWIKIKRSAETLAAIVDAERQICVTAPCKWTIQWFDFMDYNAIWLPYAYKPRREQKEENDG